MKGMIVLAVLSAIISLLPLISTGLGIAGGFISLILIIPFVFLGIKRSHDAGKSGWMVLTHILLAIGISVALTFILQAVGMMPSDEAVNAAAESGDLSAVMEASAKMAKASAIPSAISSVVGTLLTAYLVNMFNKSDPGDNQFGPATVGDS